MSVIDRDKKYLNSIGGYGEIKSSRNYGTL